MARPAQRPQNERGRKILDLLDDAGLDLAKAAKLADVDYGTFRRWIHFDSSSSSVEFVSKVLTALPIPVEVGFPALAEALEELGFEKKGRRRTA